MVNTERRFVSIYDTLDYNILNIVVNTELTEIMREYENNYNILNIVVNTELMLPN